MHSDWFLMGQSDHSAGKPKHYGSVRVAGLRFGKRAALSDWRRGWDTGDIQKAREASERARALVDAPIIGRVVSSLSECSYEARRETALGFAAQLSTDPENRELAAMLSGAIASAKAGSGIDTESELFKRTRELFIDDPMPDIRALDALRP